MLLLVTTVKLLSEVALLALLGRALLGWLAGARRDQNLFYRVLDIASRPVVRSARWLSPRVVLDRHVPLVALLLTALVWLGATAAKIAVCLEIGMQACR
jgi:hypothetical protein